jgi:ABC-type glycerol-3-phosphate transport system permease component
MATASVVSIALRPPQRHIRWSKVLGRTGIYAIAIGTVFISLVPILWLVLTSIRPLIEITSPRLVLLPRDPTLQNYVDVFTRYKTTEYLTNSIVVSLSVVVTNLIIGPPMRWHASVFGAKLSCWG